MPVTDRLIDPEGELLASGDTIGYHKGFVGDLEPGRYTAGEIRDEPGPSGYTSRRRGVTASNPARRGEWSSRSVPARADFAVQRASTTL
jgi:hypothetical protein